MPLAEKFCVEINKLPEISQWVKAFLLKREFADKVAEIKMNFQIVSAACQEVLQSDKFLKVVQITLTIGNFLNSGTFRGGFTSFKMDALIRLSELKSADQSQYTMMHYLVSQCKKGDPSLLLLPDDMLSVNQAKLGWLVEDLNVLRTDFQELKSFLNVTESQPDKFLPFGENLIDLKGFRDAAEKEIELLRQDLDDVTGWFEELCKFLGEDKNRTKPDELFGLLSNFLDIFKRAEKDIEIFEERVERENARLQWMQEKKDKTKVEADISKSTENDGTDEEKINELLKSVQQGDLFLLRRTKHVK